MIKLCEWDGCTEKIRSYKWGCNKHWKLLPREFQARIMDLRSSGKGKCRLKCQVKEWIRKYEESKNAIKIVKAKIKIRARRNKLTALNK